MKSKSKTFINVGIFVSLALVVAFGFIFFIGRERSLFSKTYKIIAPFEEIGGLRKGAMVHLSGLKIGLVDSVVLAPKEKGDHFLKVVLNIEKKYQEYLRRDSEATIETQGLLGDKFVFITPGNPKLTVLKDGDSITTAEGISITTVMAQGKKTMQRIEKAAQKMEEVLDKLPISEKDREEMRKILANVEVSTDNLGVITSNIRNGEGTVGALLTDPALYHDLRALLGHADRNKLLKGLIRATIAEQEKETRQALPEKD